MCAKFFELPDPLEGVSSEERVELRRSLVKSHEKKLPEMIFELEELLARHDSTHLLAVSAFFGLLNTISNTGKLAQTDGEYPLYQSDIEFLQAMALKFPATEGRPFLPSDLPSLASKVCQTHESFQIKGLGKTLDAPSPQVLAVHFLTTRIRAHTQRVRQWGYIQHVTDLLLRLYAPIDERIETKTGVSAHAMVLLFCQIQENIGKAKQDFINNVSVATRGKTKRDLLANYAREFGYPKGQVEEILELARERNSNVMQLKHMLISHASLSLPDVYAFSVSQLCDQCEISRDQIATALYETSHRFGELSEIDVESFFLGNPVQLKPNIQVNEEEYLCYSPDTFFAFAFQILKNIMSPHPKLLEAVDKRRSKFLEDETRTVIESAMPGADILPRFIWSDEGEQCESDLLVRIDSHLLILEAKACSITDFALRGNSNRVKKKIKELIVNPARQSLRLEQKFKRVVNGEEADDEFEGSLPFSVKDIKRILRLSITLEDFATIQSNIALLRDAELLPIDFVPIPTMCITDLRAVTETLDSTAVLLHYLTRRAELQAVRQIDGDEMDLLGIYFETTFSLEHFVDESTVLFCVGSSQPIDSLFVAREHGVEVSLPSLRMTPWWKKILHRITTMKDLRWTELAYLILSVPYDLQMLIARDLAKHRKLRKRKKVLWNHFDYTFKTIEEYSICVVIVHESEVDRRVEIAQESANHVLNRSNVFRCMVMVVRLSEDDKPYSLLALAERPANRNR